MKTCDLCCKIIKKKCKTLNCNHNFHIKCINNLLKNDIYKKCAICKTENITNILLNI